MMKSQKTK